MSVLHIEDDVLVLDDGYRVLGRPIPQTIDEGEAARSTAIRVMEELTGAPARSILGQRYF